MSAARCRSRDHTLTKERFSALCSALRTKSRSFSLVPSNRIFIVLRYHSQMPNVRVQVPARTEILLRSNCAGDSQNTTPGRGVEGRVCVRPGMNEVAEYGRGDQISQVCEKQNRGHGHDEQHHYSRFEANWDNLVSRFLLPRNVEFKWPREQPSTGTPSFDLERCVIAAHSRFVRSQLEAELFQSEPYRLLE